MAKANIVRAEVSNSAPQLVYIRYEYPAGIAAGADATSLIELDLMIPNPTDYTHFPVTELIIPDKAVDIDLMTVGVSCDSKTFDFNIFDKNGVAPDLIDTTFEICIYYDLQYTMSDFFLETFLVKNEDVPRTNKLYAWINNKDSIDTGPIEFIITYQVM